MKLTKAQQIAISALQANPLAWLKSYGSNYCVFPYEVKPLVVSEKTVAALSKAGLIVNRELTPEQLALWDVKLRGKAPARGWVLGKKP